MKKNRLITSVKKACSIMAGAAIACSFSAETISAQNILFVTGGPGSLGFLEGGSDEQRASITNFQTFNGNHGWGQFSNILRNNGYSLTEVREGNGGNSGINFTGINLSQYDIIVLGSNNARYSAAQVNAIDNWVQAGGGLLTISDGNFGSNWGDAPNSDQDFLNRFGIIVNQDLGTYALRRNSGDFVNGGHPILAGVNAFDGEGVSPLSVANNIPGGVNVTRLVRARNSVRLNNGNPGSSRANGNRDGAIIVASKGQGRVCAYYDRNTFFNQNGAGTNINRLDNRRLALNIMGWLNSSPTPPPPSNGNFQAGITISLKGNNGLFVSSENGNGPMNCNRGAVGAWEKFTVAASTGGTFSLRSSQGRFVSSEFGNNPITANRTAVGAWERFTINSINGNTISLKSSNNLFISSENGQGPMTANRTAVGAWEQFTWKIEN